MLANILPGEPSLQGHVSAPILTDAAISTPSSAHIIQGYGAWVGASPLSELIWYILSVLLVSLVTFVFGSTSVFVENLSYITSYSVGVGESLAFSTLRSLDPSIADRYGVDKNSIQDNECISTSETLPWRRVLPPWIESYNRRRSPPLHARSKRPSDLLFQVLRFTTSAYGLLLVTKRFGDVQPPTGVILRP